MATLFRNNWPLGWTPNAAEIGGDPRGLLRADNLDWREDGAIETVLGTAKISSGPLSTWASQLYSKTLRTAAGAQKLRYAVTGTSIIRNYGGAGQETVWDKGIISGASGDTTRVGFGFGMGHVFITYGNQKVKDDGSNQTPIGMGAAASMFGTANNQPTLIASPDGTNPTISNFTLWESLVNGSVFTAAMDYCEIDSDPDMLNAIAILGLTNFFSLNADNIAGVPNSGTPEDTYFMSVRIGDTSTFVKVIVAFMLQDPAFAGTISDAQDYYQFEWGELSAFNQGVNAWSTIQCKKKDFVRNGTNDALGWDDIRGIKVTFVSTVPQTFVFNDMKFIGGPLTGRYQYYQVNVQNNGFYLEKSKPSPISGHVDVKDATIQVFPSTLHPNANQAWIYRVGGQLTQPYLVSKRVSTLGGSPANFTDVMSDEEALLQNEPLNLFEENLPDNIVGMECNWKGRNWYITFDSIFPSSRDNPSNYDLRLVIENAGKNTEFNYFITRRDNDTLILGTNVDLYEITGTAGIISENEVDFFDITLRPLGLQNPPISTSFAVHEGNLFYLASDGVRILSGSNCALLTDPIDQLFNNQIQQEIQPVRVVSNLTEYYYITISRNKVYYSTVLHNNRRALFVLDISTKSWRFEDHGDQDSIAALWTEDDETLIYSTASFGDKFVRILGTGGLFDGSNPKPFVYRTVWDDNGQPRNRKDPFTLKILANSINSPLTIKLRGSTQATNTADSNQIREATFTQGFDGLDEKIFNISMIPVKAFQLEITGTVPYFQLINWSVDYEPRPEQLSQLRIPSTTFGIAGRKRLQELPFIIDTLGNEVHFIPILDGLPVTDSTHGSTQKMLSTHYFRGDISAVNVGAYLYGTLFEFYELIQPREIELLPDPVKYKLIPYNNLGTASRKRFVQYAIVIDTRGQNVNMIPYIDGIAHPIQVINTNFKKTVVYTFDTLAVGTDIACVLESLTETPFEFYNIDLDESISEKLPPKTQALSVACTNFGIAAPKRIRTIPFVIDTFGSPVTYTPFVDGVQYPFSTHVTNGKRTVLHYFNEDNGLGIPFGIDYCGQLTGPNDFEFYELLKPENVETLPVGKTFDQLGPIEFNRVGKIREISVRMVPTGSEWNFRLYASDVELMSGSLITAPWKERVYRIPCIKGINPQIFRMEMWSPSVFHRIDALVKVNIDGAHTENKWVKIK